MPKLSNSRDHPAGAAADDAPCPPSARHARRLLVIDDQPDVAQMLRRIGESQGYEAQGVTDPTQAFSRFMAFEPDAVLLDLVMPNVDGIEILRMIRASGRTPRILVMSGYGEFYLRMVGTLATGAGMANVATAGKPVRRDELLRFLAGEMQGGDAGAGAPAKAPA